MGDRGPGASELTVPVLLPSLYSEVLAGESVACLTQALSHLRGIWEEIGIPEEQRLQRTEVVKRHVKVSGPGRTGAAGG